jgi:hypothetical protein
VFEKRVLRRIFGGRGGSNIKGMAEIRISTKVLETKAESILRFTKNCQ